MAKYIKLFDTNSQYESYITGASADLPNASYISNGGISRLKSDKVPMVSMSIDTSDVKVGDTATVTVTVNEDAKGQVELLLKDLNASLVYSEVRGVKDGKVVFEVPGTAFPGAGVYWAKARYFGDTKYLTNRTAGTFEVTRNVPTIGVRTTVDETTAEIEVITPLDATGFVYVTLNGEPIDGDEGICNILNGSAQTTASDLDEGNYTVAASFPGDIKYEPATASTSFTIVDERETTVLLLDADDGEVGYKVIITCTCQEDASGDIHFSIVNDSTQEEVWNGEVENEEGKAVVEWAPSVSGVYTIYATYSGDSGFKPASTDTTITIS